MPPAGWTIENLQNQWSVSQSSNAGGTVPEGKFNWTNTTAVTRLITPEIDLTGLTTFSGGKYLLQSSDGRQKTYDARNRTTLSSSPRTPAVYESNLTSRPGNCHTISSHRVTSVSHAGSFGP